MGLPKFLQPYLPSYNIDDLEKGNYGVDVEIITSILNLGDEKAVSWVFENYTLEEIRNVAKNPLKGVWNEESFNYWSRILKIDKPRGYRKAIQNIYP